MVLRNYQELLINKLARKIYKGTKNIVGQLATGGGKTIIFSGISYRYLEKNKSKSVLIAVHRKELLQQTRKTVYKAYELECHPIIAGTKYLPLSPIYVGMVESLYRRIDKLYKTGVDIGVLIIDECHRLEFVKLLDKCRQIWPNVIIIGFSATPLTANKKKPLNKYYEDIVCGVDIPELIEQGHLCQNITYAPKEIVERNELAMKGGEFDESLMAIEFSKPRYIHNTVSAYEKWIKGQKTLIFNVNIEHSKAVCEAFVASGYNCRHLDSEMSSHSRTEILYWYSVTENAILCNVGITTTGFDEPTVEAIIVNSSMMSMPLWLQKCGRGSRPTPAKSMFTIIDMGGNAVTLGDWSASRNWTDIFFNPPLSGKSSAAPCKSCPKCECIIAAAARVCPYCGYEYPEREREIEAELHEFIIVTKNIDVAAIIKAHRHRKEWYPFFKIGKDLAIEAKNKIPAMSDEYAIFILGSYLELARKWLTLFNDARPEKPRKKFTKWYEAKAQETLFLELKNRFPDWESDLIPLPPSEAPNEPAPAYNGKVESITNIENLKSIHYNL